MQDAERPEDSHTATSAAPESAPQPAVVQPGPTQEAPDPQKLPMLLESLLFVAAEPTPIARLADVLGTSKDAVEAALEELARACDTATRGIRLQRKGDRVQLTSAPDATPFIERFLGLDLSTKLSPAALETLAVIAYRQPLTRAEIEAVRGVGCDGVMRTLITRELVEPVGRLEQAGRPFQYGTTFQFLQYFGLTSPAALPPLPEESTNATVTLAST